jgi:hypothetical protein
VVSRGCRSSSRLVRFAKEILFLDGASTGWAGARWGQDLDARAVLVYPAIPNVDRDAEPMSELVGRAG